MQSTRLRQLITNQSTVFCAIRCTSQGPLPKQPTEGSLSYKYEKFISRWPKFLTLHRMVVDGSRWCFSDVKTYIRVRRDISAKRRTLEELSVEELEVLVQAGREIRYLLLLAACVEPPVFGELLIILAIFFPRLILTRHFWTDKQRAEFFAKEVVAAQEKASNLKDSFKTNTIEKLSLPAIADLNAEKTTTLAKLHGLIPLPLPGLERRLIYRSKALHRLDRILSFDALTDRQLVFHCYIRRINFTGLSPEQMRAALQTWVLLTGDLSESSYLAAPLLFNVANK